MVAQDIIFSNLQIGIGSNVVSRSATIFESWLYRLLPLLYFGSTIGYHILYRVQVLLPRRKIVRRSGVYIFSGKSPTFSASCKNSEQYEFHACMRMSVVNAKHTEHIVRGAISINIYQCREKRFAFRRVREVCLWYKEEF